MPELPEVELLKEHLQEELIGWRIHRTNVIKPRVVRPESPEKLARCVKDSEILGIQRKGKYLLILLSHEKKTCTLFIHLGMTGRLYALTSSGQDKSPHGKVAIEWECDQGKLVFQDPRTLGRVSMDPLSVDRLGPDAWTSGALSKTTLRERLGKSRSPIKTLLMDQHRVAGLGNIYVNESLFRAGIHPEQSGCALSEVQWQRLFDGIRGALDEAFTHGRSCSLDWQGSHQSDGFFYFGSQSNNRSKKEERFRVYDRAHQPCLVCQASIKKMQIAGRSAYYCPKCQSL